MSGVNKAIILGRLGKDPEVREAGSGKVANFSVATSEKWKDKDGVYQERTEWHNIVAWNKLADLAEKYLVKGKEIYIEGKIKTDSYEKDGEKRYSTKIHALGITFVGSKGDSSSEKKEEVPF